jgi:hypothetical protein
MNEHLVFKMNQTAAAYVAGAPDAAYLIIDTR